MKKRYRTAVLGLLCLACAVSGCRPSGRSVVYDIGSSYTGSSHIGSSSEIPSPEGERERSIAAEPQTLFVHVCGEVRTPGVYELPAGSRIWQAIDAAGGLTEEADDRLLNQAALLEDGMQIRVSPKQETDAPAEGETMTDSAGRVNLNLADRDALMSLPGIGEVRAAAIIEYRELHGVFSAPEELMNIEGIGEKSYSRLKELVTV